jgi:ABC-type amino acid transport substrate-binding protein
MTRAPSTSDSDVVEADERTPLVNGTHAQAKSDDADTAIENGQCDVVPTSRATIVGILSTLMLGR